MPKFDFARCDLDKLIELFLKNFEEHTRKKFNRSYFNKTARHLLSEQISDEEINFILEEMINRGNILEIIR
mgnify:FL=1